MVGYGTDFFIPLFGSVARNSFGHELNHKSVGPLKNVKNHLEQQKKSIIPSPICIYKTVKKSAR